MKLMLSRLKPAMIPTVSINNMIMTTGTWSSHTSTLHFGVYWHYAILLIVYPENLCLQGRSGGLCPTHAGKLKKSTGGGIEDID